MDDPLSRYLAATEAGDVDGFMATLAPDVEVVSPISGRMVFRGQEDVRVLLAAVYGTLSGLRWTTPDQALSFRAQAIGIAVINATGNISSALNPVVVGWLKDATQKFTAGLLYSAVLLVIGAAIVMALPIARRQR